MTLDEYYEENVSGEPLTEDAVKEAMRGYADVVLKQFRKGLVEELKQLLEDGQ